MLVSTHTAQAPQKPTHADPHVRDHLWSIERTPRDSRRAIGLRRCRRRAHKRSTEASAFHCFPCLRWFPYSFSKRGTAWTSARFRAGQIPNPYPSHYRTAFASSRILHPHPPGPHLRSAYLRSAQANRNDPGPTAGSVPILARLRLRPTSVWPSVASRRASPSRLASRCARLAARDSPDSLVARGRSSRGICPCHSFRAMPGHKPPAVAEESLCPMEAAWSA